jgi:hypothetical protein
MMSEAVLGEILMALFTICHNNFKIDFTQASFAKNRQLKSSITYLFTENCYDLRRLMDTGLVLFNEKFDTARTSYPKFLLPDLNPSRYTC